VLCNPHLESSWKSPHRFEPETFRPLGFAQRRLGTNRQRAGSSGVKRSFGRSGSTWQNYEICNYDQFGVVDLSFLRTRGACPRCGLARVQRTTEGVGRLWGSPSPDIVEERACPRPYALIYGPSVISSTERVLVLCLFVISRDVLCVSCVRRLLGGGEAEDISLFHYGRYASLLPPPSMVRLDRLYHVPSLQPPFRTFASQCTLYPHLTPIRSAHLAYISSIPLTQSVSHSTVDTWLKAVHHRNKFNHVP